MDGNLACGLAGLVGIAAVVLSRKQSEGRPKGTSRRLSTHPLFAWAVENVSVLGVTVFADRLFPHPRQTFASLCAHTLPSHILQVAGLAVVQWILTHVVYSHMPHFGGQARPLPSITVQVWDYTKSAGLPTLIVVGGICAALPTMSSGDFAQMVPAIDRISPMLFLLKLFIMRVCVDIGFYTGHRMLHHRSLYWMHRYHHQHYKPMLASSFHFNPLDYITEAGIPVGLGFAALWVLGLQATLFEMNLLTGYISWHLQGSHCAKPLPTVTYFPPLAPLYQLLLGPVDIGNVCHHDLHHARLSCNYGISIWLDILMGTRHEDFSFLKGDE